MANVSKNLRDGTIKLKDGTLPTRNEIELPLEEGDLSFTVTRNVNQVHDRGKLSHVTEADEVPVSVSFTVKYIELIRQTGAADPTLYEAVRFKDAAAHWKSTTELNLCSGVKTLDLIFEVKNQCTNEESERITFKKFYFEEIEFSEGDEYNTLSVSGTSFVTEPDVEKFNCCA